jgi:hypothetical protein
MARTLLRTFVYYLLRDAMDVAAFLVAVVIVAGVVWLAHQGIH